MNFNIEIELKKIILKTKYIKDTFNKPHPNTKYSLDIIIHEILYFLKSGVSWGQLRSPINPKTLFWHFSRFTEHNIFLKLFNKVKNIYLKKFMTNNTSLLIDSTIIYNKNGINKLGRNKFYKNKQATKISLMTDINGFPLSVLFMKGNYHDNSVFEKHIKDAIIICNKSKQKITIIADKAYSSKNNYDLLDTNKFSHIIPPRKNMKIFDSYKYDKKEYMKRIKIEHIFSRIKVYKRINLRYDKTINHYSNFLYIVLTIISANILNKK